MPSRTSGSENHAWSAATHRSHASTRAMPAAMASPFTAAISGLPVTGLVPGRGVKSSVVGRPSTFFSVMSNPAQNALSPAPVTIPARTSGSSSIRFQQSISASQAARFRALRFSGRLIVTTATWSSTW